MLLLLAIVLGWSTLLGRAATAQPGFTESGALPGLGSGRIWSVAIQPNLPSTIMAGTDVGVFISHDSGSTWTLTLPGVHVWTVGFDARSNGNAFAGTDGKGVYASLDAGATWTPASTGLQNLDVRSLAFGLDGIAAGTGAGVALSPNGQLWHDGGLDGYSIAAVAVGANYPQFTVIAGSRQRQRVAGVCVHQQRGRGVGGAAVRSAGGGGGVVDHRGADRPGRAEAPAHRRDLAGHLPQRRRRGHVDRGHGQRRRGHDDHGRHVRAARPQPGVCRGRRRRQHRR